MVDRLALRGAVSGDLVARLLPVLGRSKNLGFNVFDVMHHGLHEKQISNVFRWLLDANGSHKLSDRFTRIFIEEVDRACPAAKLSPNDGYWVQQEVNTSEPGVPGDIADLVLESVSVAIVVENFYTSDGHGHSYAGYLAYGKRQRDHSVVVLLCEDEQRSLLKNGWEQAAVLTYTTLLARLHSALAADRNYQRKNPEAYSFIVQMHRKFVEGEGLMDDQGVLGFVVAMCQVGEAHRYQLMRHDVAAEQFASDLAAQAKDRFGDSRQLLQRIKARLKNFSDETLRRQLNGSLGEGFVRDVSASYSGIYQWTINFRMADEINESGESHFQLKFGPSAWHTIEQDPDWRHAIGAAGSDYSRLFITWGNHEVRASTVTLNEVLDGLQPTDRRLHDEILQIRQDNRSAAMDTAT